MSEQVKSQKKLPPVYSEINNNFELEKGKKKEREKEREEGRRRMGEKIKWGKIAEKENHKNGKFAKLGIFTANHLQV